jgi:general secretion pathway protein K
MVLMVVTVLAVLAGGFAYSMKVETRLARNSSSDTDLDWLGRSGIEVAKYCLNQRNGISGSYDFLGQAWAGGRTETNELVARLLGTWNPLGNGEFRVTIEDLDRRMNINMANETVLRQALSLIGADASMTPTIVNSILDWIDPDDNPGPQGAEKDFYLHLDPPYLPKNGRIDDLSELLLVNGIRDSPGLYWGSGGPPSHRVPKSARQSQFEEPIYAVGFKDLFCTLSAGRLNINTASAIAMQVFPFIDEHIAQAIIARRAGPDGQDGTEDDFPFRSPQEISTIPGVNPALIGPFQQMLSVQSSVFEVKVQTRVGKHARTYTAYVRRAAGQMQTLNLLWQDE